MPEDISGKDKAFGVALRGEAASRGTYLMPEEVKALAEKFDVNRIGDGSECVVIEKEGKPEKVVAFRYFGMEAEEAKALFYSQRIFSTLFPHNFPHFYASFGRGRDEAGIAGSIREKRVGYSPQSFNRRDFSGGPGEIKYSFDYVIDTCRTLGIPVSFDQEGPNFVLGADGGEYYLDTPRIRMLRFGTWDAERIMSHMEQARTPEGQPRYDGRDRRIVRKSIERLAALGIVKLKTPPVRQNINVLE